MKAKIFDWFVNPDKNVLVGIDCNKHVVTWQCDHGRVGITADNLNAAIREAYAIDHNPNKEFQIRATHASTITKQAYTCGIQPDGRYGWQGHVQIGACMPIDAEFALPKLPKGWSWVPFSTTSGRRRKPARTVGYLCGGHDDNTTHIDARFHFKVVAPYELFATSAGDNVLGHIYEALAEFERTNFIIQ